MESPALLIYNEPKLTRAKMIIGLSGWMDGGDVSTGVIEQLSERLNAKEFAEIDPEEFYIYNFPGSMEISALFRPHVKLEDGMVTEYAEPSNEFYCSEEHQLILFSGKEPNLRWNEYAECLFEIAEHYGVSTIWFVGSVAGTVPHTKAPRFFASVSDEKMKELFDRFQLKPSNYEGPASIITHMMTFARDRGIAMGSLVAEIPAYVQGRNIKCIAAAAEKICAILDIEIDLDDLKIVSQEFDKRLTETAKKRPELAELIRKMELEYDKEQLQYREEDLRAWFEKQNLRLN
ncbi:MAG TPA: PAC2 family protein [Candidatus Hydrogenedentes bacterium]|nr:PAC2 family protein [Candidatus Hydrogenedentota bacterium]HOL75686.1 PAC2 family protein [Candidatus Hydrogenedentota bacterium]HPO84321.1 PAC2 family protein [Candidatus Hydrogenedentota bacterium]